MKLLLWQVNHSFSPQVTKLFGVIKSTKIQKYQPINPPKFFSRRLNVSLNWKKSSSKYVRSSGPSETIFPDDTYYVRPLHLKRIIIPAHSLTLFYFYFVVGCCCLQKLNEHTHRCCPEKQDQIKRYDSYSFLFRHIHIPAIFFPHMDQILTKFLKNDSIYLLDRNFKKNINQEFLSASSHDEAALSSSPLRPGMCKVKCGASHGLVIVLVTEEERWRGRLWFYICIIPVACPHIYLATFPANLISSLITWQH